MSDALSDAAWIGVAMSFVAMMGGLVLFAIYGETKPIQRQIDAMRERIDKLEKAEDRLREAEIRLGPGGEKP